MTPEEMREMIANMLKVQSELQQSQLKHEAEIKDLSDATERITDSMDRITDSIENMREIVRGSLEGINDLREIIADSNRRIDRQISNLVGYSLTAETERLSLEERMRILERRLDRLEKKD